MRIDDLFSIAITFQCRGTGLQTLAVTASSFFDPDVTTDYTEDDWDCDLPWSKCSIEEFLPDPELTRRTIEWLQLIIRQKRTGAHRHLMWQYWQHHVLMSEWAGKSESVSNLNQLIFELAEGEIGAFQILKLGISTDAVQINSHSRYSNTDEGVAVQWLKTPVLPKRLP